MFRLLPALVGLVLLLGSGVVHRLWTGAWAASNEPATSAARLANVPLTIGDWEGRSNEIDERSLKVAQAEGYLLRHYVQRGTRKEVTVLIVCGRPGPICVHTPDVCFRGTGFQMEGEESHFQFDGTEEAAPAEFIKADMSKSRPGVSEHLRVYWSWKTTGSWRTPAARRLVFGAAPALYKLYLVYQGQPGEKLPDEDPCMDFMRELLPELDKALNPTS